MLRVGNLIFEGVHERHAGAVDCFERMPAPRVAWLDPHFEDLFDLPVFMKEEFDYILEYTCFCAIDPQRRAEYIESVSNLLKPGGYFIALAFPIGQRTGGPPFLVAPDELIEPLGERGFELVMREIPDISVPGREGIEELLVLKKKDSSF